MNPSSPPRPLCIAEDVPGQRLVLRGGFRGWHRLSFARDRLVARPGFFASGLSRIEVPVAELEAPVLRIERSRGAGAWSIELDARPYRLVFSVEHLDRPEEALDLVARLASALGFPRYRLLEKGEGIVEVELRREGGADPFREAASVVVPVVEGPAEYAPVAELGARVAAAPSRRRSRGFVEPEKAPPRFEPHRTLDKAQAVEWHPGERVVFLRPSQLHPVLAFLFLFLVVPAYVFFGSLVVGGGFGLGAMVLGLPICLLIGMLWGGVYAAFGILYIPLVACGWLLGIFRFSWDSLRRFRWSFARETVFDWHEGTVTFRLWHFTRKFGLADVRGLILLENSDSETSENQPTRTWDWCEVEVVLPGLNEVILKTDKSERAGEARQHAESLVVELARALDVPWRVAKGWAPYY